ncbi:hypothetical protein lerEdw1_018937 [Lerista edwardsae]|nr:hypothetical protein lerEdw1_018937 [Lerista edwardsae]
MLPSGELAGAEANQQAQSDCGGNSDSRKIPPPTTYLLWAFYKPKSQELQACCSQQLNSQTAAGEEREAGQYGRESNFISDAKQQHRNRQAVMATGAESWGMKLSRAKSTEELPRSQFLKECRRQAPGRQLGV